MEDDVIVYPSRFMPGWWAVDCEEHGVSATYSLFSAAIGRAMFHRQAVIQ